MARYAVIESGTVNNIIEWDGSAAGPDASKCVLITDDAVDIGSTYDGSTFTNPVVNKPALTYEEARKNAYPSIGDQLDMLWHAVDTGDWTAAKVKTTEFYTALKTVKDANSKP